MRKGIGRGEPVKGFQRELCSDSHVAETTLKHFPA